MPAQNVPPRPSEDIQSILSRFQSWAGKQQGNSGSAHPEVREIPMEEAIEQLRRRRTGRGTAVAATAVQPAVPAKTPEVKPVAAAPIAAAETKQPAAPPVEAKPPVPASALTITKAPAAPALAKPVRATPVEPKATKRREPSATASKKKKKAKAALAASPKNTAARKPAAPKKKKADKVPAAAAKAAAPQRKQLRARRKPAPARAAGPAFREVLAHSVQQEDSSSRSSAERPQRVSVRLSQQEEHRLQTAAAQAGVTVSEYLRRCALVPAAARPAHAPMETVQHQPATLFETAPAKASVFGDWLSLLRNRFLASPARIAERA